MNEKRIIYKNLFSIILFSICILFINNKNVFAENTRTLEINDINKIWTIKFNKEISVDESIKECVMVLDDASNSVESQIELGKDKKSIIVKPPIKGYKYNETYCLIITKKLKGKNNKSLKKDHKLYFYIKHKSKEINRDDGLLDDDLIAYEDEYIYFANIEDNYNIYKVKYGDNKKQLICPESVSKLNVENGWIYYKSSVDNNYYKIRTNGTNKHRLDSKEEIENCNKNNLIKMSDLKHTDDKVSIKIENRKNEEDIDVDIEGIFYDVGNKEIIIMNENSSFYFEKKQVEEEISGYYLSEIEGSKDLIYLGTVLKNINMGGHYDEEYIKVGSKELINPNYSKRIELITSEKNIKEVLDNREKERKKFLENREKERKEEYKNNGYKPLKIEDTYITYNIIDMPEVNLEVKNLSNKTIDAYEMELECYDTYDRPTKYIISNSNKFFGISQNNELEPYKCQTDTWDLTWYENVTKVKNVKVVSVHFTDGTVWRP